MRILRFSALIIIMLTAFLSAATDGNPDSVRYYSTVSRLQSMADSDNSCTDALAAAAGGEVVVAHPARSMASATRLK